MSERQLSLTDVMNGMNRLSLNMRLTPPLFQFFWGLIMTANSLEPRFKNPFDLTVGQAIGIGGGNSRQAVWAKQQKLKKIKIDGQYLVKIENGDRQKNVPATYDISYDLIVPPSLALPELQAHQSKIIDSSVDGSVDCSATDPLTILRSDQKRGDQDPHTIPNVVTTSMGDEKVSENGNGGNFFKVKEEKDQDEVEWLKMGLDHQGLRDPWKTEIAEQYDTTYVVRQIRQIKLDDPNNVKFTNHAGVLVTRIKGGHKITAKELSEEEFAEWQWPGASSDNL